MRRLNGGKGVDYVVECSGAPNAVNDAIRMVNRGGKVCLAAFPHQETPVDVAHIVRNNIYLYGIRGEGRSATHRAEALMAQKRFDATKIHTHTFALDDLPTAIRYAKDRVDDAIKVVVKAKALPRTGSRRSEGAAQRHRLRIRKVMSGAFAARLLQHIAGLRQQVRNIDAGKRIGAGDDQNIARLAWRRAPCACARPAAGI